MGHSVVGYLEPVALKLNSSTITRPQKGGFSSGIKMELNIDTDVKSVLEFMQDRIQTDKLTAVAESVAGIAPVLWGHFEASPLCPLRLTPEPLSATQSTATG
jgi:hypothetical protein